MATRSTNMVFVFGSNCAGKHGAGAALFAYRQRGARYGFSYGHMSDSFAIPTKDQDLQTLPLERIQQYVEGFIAYAIDHPELTFQVTRVGCGLAGLKDVYMASMFELAPVNCQFDEKWKPWLDEQDYKFWGTFD